MKAKDFETVCLHRMQKEEELGRAMMVRYGTQGSWRKGQPVDTAEFERRMLSQFMNDADRVTNIRRTIADLIQAAKESADGWQPQSSLPDFTGALAPKGRAFDFDCKVCGGPSLSLHDEKFKKRQLAYLLKRSVFGAVTFVLIHFTERVLKKSTDPPQTWAFPVVEGHAFWESVQRGETKSIGRSDCQEYAVFVSWNTLPGGRTPRPDILAAVYELAARRNGK